MASPQDEGIEIDVILGDVTDATQRLEHCVQNLDRQQSARTYKNTDEGLREVKAVRQTVHSTRQEMLRRMDSFKNRIQVEIRSLCPALAAHIHTYLYQMVQAGVESRSIELAESGPRRPLPAALLCYPQLLEILNVEPLEANAAVEYVIRQGYGLETSALAQSNALMLQRGFNRWLRSSESGMILVDAHCDRATIGRISPMSVFCASFATHLKTLREALVLHFSCSLHSNPKDSLRGPQGLMRSLIAQLLFRSGTESPRLDFINSQRLVLDLEKWELGALSHVFRCLVQRLPGRATVFCIVEGISEFERKQDGWGAKLCDVARALQILAAPGDNGPMVKLMLTSSTRSTLVVKEVAASQRISLSAGEALDRPVSGRGMLLDFGRTRSAQNGT